MVNEFDATSCGLSGSGSAGGGEFFARDYIDMRCCVIEANSNEKFTELKSGITDICREINSLKNTAIGPLQFWGGVLTTVVSILGVLLTVYTVSGDRFEGGMTAGQITAHAELNKREIEVQRRENEIQRKDIDLSKIESNQLLDILTKNADKMIK